VTATFSCRVAAGGELRVTVTAPGGLAPSRQAWLATELDFLARTCRHVPPADLATLLLRYTSAAVTAGAGGSGGGADAVVEVTAVGAVGATSEAAGIPGRLPPAGRAPSQAPSRATGQQAFAVEHKEFGRVVIVHELAGLGVYLLRIAPGGTIPWHVHRVMCEAELVLGSGLLLQGRAVPRGLAVRWPRGHPHSYHNPTGEVQTVLCVDMPEFIPADEIEVPAPRVPAFPAEVTVHRPGAPVAAWTAARTE